MIIKIRKSTFETNSSSVHVLTVKKKKRILTDKDIINIINEDFLYIEDSVSGKEYISIYDDDEYEFGSSFKILNQPTEKMAYLIAISSGFILELIEMAKELGYAGITIGNVSKPRNDDNNISEEISNKIGKVLTDENTSDISRKSESIIGYVDENCLTDLIKNGINLKNFIFDPAHTIITGSDNDSTIRNLFKLLEKDSFDTKETTVPDYYFEGN